MSSSTSGGAGLWNRGMENRVANGLFLSLLVLAGLKAAIMSNCDLRYLQWRRRLYQLAKDELLMDFARHHDVVYGTVCSGCGKHGAAGMCGGCLRVRYCSTECATADWKERHRPMCGMEELTREEMGLVEEATGTCRGSEHYGEEEETI